MNKLLLQAGLDQGARNERFRLWESVDLYIETLLNERTDYHPMADIWLKEFVHWHVSRPDSPTSEPVQG